MRDFILDASVALAWCFDDESTEKSVALLDSLERNTAHVPAIWSLEIGNILVSAERRKRITHAKIAQFLELISYFNIHVDNETATRAFHEIIALAYSEKITTYDASYLELAMRLDLPLATKDIELSQAGKKLGISIISV